MPRPVRHAAPPLATWHGTTDDRLHLWAALIHNCAARGELDAGGATGSRCYTCPSCLLTTDQHALDCLAFVATLRARLRAEEADGPQSDVTGFGEAQRAQPDDEDVHAELWSH